MAYPSQDASQSVLALTPETIRIAVVASHHTRELFDTCMERSGAAATPASAVAATKLVSMHMCGMKILVTEAPPMIRMNAIVIGRSTSSPVSPATAAAPSKAMVDKTSTVLMISTEFAHTVSPFSSHYAVVLMLQFAGDQASNAATRAAVTHWQLQTPHLRLHVLRVASAVAAHLEDLAARGRSGPTQQQYQQPKSLGNAPAVSHAANRAIGFLWASCGVDHVSIIRARCMAAPCSSWTTAVATVGHASREAAIRRQEASGGDPPATPSVPSSPTSPKRRSKFAGLAPGLEVPAWAARVHEQTSMKDQLAALEFLARMCPEGASALITGLLGLSHPDALESPFAYGMQGSAAGIPLSDLADVTAGDEMGRHSKELDETYRSVESDLTAQQQAVLDAFRQYLERPVEWNTAARVVIVSEDPDIGQAAMTVAAMLFRPDAAAARAHRALYNPDWAHVHSDLAVQRNDQRSPDRGANDSDCTSSEDDDFETPGPVSAPFAAEFPTFALGVEAIEDARHRPVQVPTNVTILPGSPILWICAAELTAAETQVLVSTANYDAVLICNLGDETSPSAPRATSPQAARGSSGVGASSPQQAGPPPSGTTSTATLHIVDCFIDVAHSIGVVPRQLRTEPEASVRCTIDVTPSKHVTARLAAALGGVQPFGSGRPTSTGVTPRGSALEPSALYSVMSQPLLAAPPTSSRDVADSSGSFSTSPAAMRAHVGKNPASAVRTMDLLALLDTTRFGLLDRARSLRSALVSQAATGGFADWPMLAVSEVNPAVPTLPPYPPSARDFKRDASTPQPSSRSTHRRSRSADLSGSQVQPDGFDALRSMMARRMPEDVSLGDVWLSAIVLRDYQVLGAHWALGKGP